jgi:hypothetical protein
MARKLVFISPADFTISCYAEMKGKRSFSRCCILMVSDTVNGKQDLRERAWNLLKELRIDEDNNKKAKS